MDNKVLRNLSYGVYVVTTKDNDKNVGCIANSVMQVTSSPSIVAISINHDNYTNKCIKENNTFAVSILKEDSNPNIIGEFGFKSSKDTNKFENIDYEIKNDMPIINDSCGYFICKVINTIETSTHTIFLGEIVKMDGFTNDNPMTYKYYHEKLKGTSPKNAPTYQEEIIKKEEKSTKKWKCKICGYVYEGEKVPEDYICPICGQPHTEFYEVN